MPSVANTHARIIAILELITDLTVVHETVPRALNDADLPSALVIPQQLTRTRQAGDNVHEDRRYSIQVMLRNARGGISGEAESAIYALDIFEDIYSQFDGRQRLELDDSGIAVKALLVGDSGLQLLQYPQGSDNFYLGIVFTLSVESVFRTSMKRNSNQ